MIGEQFRRVSLAGTQFAWGSWQTFALVALARIEQDRLQEDEDRESLLRGFDAEDPNAPPHPAQALAQPRDKHKAPRVQP